MPQLQSLKIWAIFSMSNRKPIYVRYRLHYKFTLPPRPSYYVRCFAVSLKQTSHFFAAC